MQIITPPSQYAEDNGRMLSKGAIFRLIGQWEEMDTQSRYLVEVLRYLPNAPDRQNLMMHACNFCWSSTLTAKHPHSFRLSYEILPAFTTRYPCRACFPHPIHHEAKNTKQTHKKTLHNGRQGRGTERLLGDPVHCDNPSCILQGRLDTVPTTAGRRRTKQASIAGRRINTTQRDPRAAGSTATSCARQGQERQRVALRPDTRKVETLLRLGAQDHRPELGRTDR